MSKTTFGKLQIGDVFTFTDGDDYSTQRAVKLDHPFMAQVFPKSSFGDDVWKVFLMDDNEEIVLIKRSCQC